MKKIKGKNLFSETSRLPVGTNVLLARPTGKGKIWQIVDRMHEKSTQISNVSVDVTPVNKAPRVIQAFSADPTTSYTNNDIILSAEFAHGSKKITSLILDADNDTDPTEYEIDDPTNNVEFEVNIQYSTVGEKNPTLTITYGSNDETEIFSLDNGPITIGEVSVSSFVADNTSPDINETVTVTAQFEDTFSDVDNYDIDWGDGNTENFSNTSEVE